VNVGDASHVFAPIVKMNVAPLETAAREKASGCAADCRATAQSKFAETGARRAGAKSTGKVAPN
jgi:hypothetical protein